MSSEMNIKKTSEWCTETKLVAILVMQEKWKALFARWFQIEVGKQVALTSF